MSLEDAILDFAWYNLPHKDRLIAARGGTRTTWLLGAGASRHFSMNAWGVQMPLARDFFRAMYNLPTASCLHARIGDLCSYVSATRGCGLDELDEDIETFMTSVESHIATLRRPRDAGPAQRVTEESAGLALTASNMRFIIANVINEAQNGPTSICYDELLKYCGPEDTFISLNWDTLLDRSLAATGCWEPNNGYGITFDAAFSGRWRRGVPYASRAFKCGWRLLKLHGSTNWLTAYHGVHPTTLAPVSSVPGYKHVFLYWDGTLSFEAPAGRWRGGYAPTCYGYYPPNVPTRYFSESELAAWRSWIRVRPRMFDVHGPPREEGVATAPLFIPPIRRKQYVGYSRAIEGVWEAADSGLRSAERIVVIGYSFPHTDAKIKDLILEACSARGTVREVVVVDPNAEEVVELLGLGGDGCGGASPFSGTLEDYLAALARERATRMRHMADADSDVRNWVQRIWALAIRGMEDRAIGGDCPGAGVAHRAP